MDNDTPINPAAPDRANAVCPKCGMLAWCLPAGMDSQQTRLIHDLTEHGRPVKRGESLHHAGAALKSLYMIRTGSVKSCFTSEDGRDQIIGFSFPGELIGVDAIHGGKHLCTVVALEESTACGIHYGEFETLGRRIPALQHHFNSMMSREITRNYDLMLQLGSMRAEERVALFLLNLSSRYAARGYSSTKFNLQMSRMEIGTYLGLKIETVSRVFSSFRKERLVAVNHKNTEIMCLKGLQEVTGDRRSGTPV